MKDRVPNCRLVFAGKGPEGYEKKLHQRIREYDLQDRVFFMGHVTQEKIRGLYQYADIALFPTLTQGGWLSPFEALATGTAIIVKDSFTAAELIKTNDLGQVCDDFKPAVLNLIEDSKMRKRQLSNASNWIMKNLSWRKYSKHVQSIYDLKG